MSNKEIEIKNARITKARLGYEDHGILTCYLQLDYGDVTQGFGDYALDSYDEKSKTRIGTAHGMEFIIQILNIVGVDEWNELVGKYVRVKADRCKVYEIGNIIRDEWFNPEEFFKKELKQ